MRRRNLFGRPIRRLKIFPILLVFTLLLAGGFFGIRFFYQDRINTLEAQVFDLELSVRAFRLPDVDAETISLDQLHRRLPYRQTAQDINFNIRILMNNAPFTFTNLFNDVQVSNNAPLQSELGPSIEAWRVRSSFTVTDAEVAYRFVERLEAAQIFYLVDRISVFEVDDDGDVVFEVEIVYFTYSVRGN